MSVAITIPETQPMVPAVGPRPRTWLRRIAGGGQIVETCPSWCASSHVNDVYGMLTDLTHAGVEVSSQTEVSTGPAATTSLPFLLARVQVDPYSDDPRRRAPHVAFEPVLDDVVEGLTPDAFAELIAQIRAHCDRLDEVHAELVAARAEH